jgi:hypothetical protein
MVGYVPIDHAEVAGLQVAVASVRGVIKPLSL